MWREGRSGSRGGFDEGDGNRTTEETATGAVVISVLLAPLQSISESLDSQEDSRIPVCTFPHLFFLSTRCGTRRGCFGALLWEGRAGILVFTGRRCVRAYRVGDVSERIDCGSRCLCRSSVAMSRAGKWRLNRRSLFPWTWIPGVVRLFGVCKKQERIICAFWTVESFLDGRHNFSQFRMHGASCSKFRIISGFRIIFLDWTMENFPR